MQVSQSAVEFREPKRREKLFLHLDLEEDFFTTLNQRGKGKRGGFAKGTEN